jgi:DNA processing protein
MSDFNSPQREELAYWLAFNMLSGTGLGFRKIKLLHDHFDGLQRAWQAPIKELNILPWLNNSIIERFIEQKKAIEPLVLLDKLENSGISAFSYFHEQYPNALRQINDPPLILFTKGDFSACDFNHSVGIVGTRKPSAYGQKLAKSIAAEFAQTGTLVVSGMAFGVDSLAHWGAISAKGKTVAVLGCGVDICYPGTNKPLYKAIVEGGGAVVSEYFPGTRPKSWHFPARNRIISGLTPALAVIEAGLESGALITAKLAFEQNREVFAIPGRIDSATSIGTNYLIAKNTAQLFRNAGDIMEEMNWVSKNSEPGTATVVTLQGREMEIYELMSAEPVHFDYLIEKTGMNTGELSAILTMLELAGVVSRLPGDWYSREKGSV